MHFNATYDLIVSFQEVSCSFQTLLFCINGSAYSLQLGGG